MASSARVTELDRCRISPPPRSVAPATLPLTFFDIPWLFFSPTQPLFFYNFPTTTTHFTQTVLPRLKHSLSLTLQHFFPLAGNLVTSSAEPHLEYTEDDSIFLTAAESASDFKNLVSNHRKMGRDFHGLVPELSGGVGLKNPLLAVQVTVFPDVGICMGFTFCNVVADWRTFNIFLRTWGSLCKYGENIELLAFYDRSVIIDPCGLKSNFLKGLKEVSIYSQGYNKDTMRATFVLGQKEMEQIKKWIMTRSEMLFGSTHLLLSPYVIACAFIWVCWMKTHWAEDYGDQIHYFGFIAGGLTRLPYTVPSNYMGNCVGFGRSSVTRNELIGANGVIYAAKAIGETIKKLNGDMLGGAKNWISEWKVVRESELHLMVTGSPKLDLYELDFGWGRPVKFEEVSIDNTGAISLTESREVIGGIEIGVSHTNSKMDTFAALFNKTLNQYLFMNA